MKILSVISFNKHDLLEDLIGRIRNRPVQDTLILVANQYMVRHLRRVLQTALHGFAPKIMTLELWLDELAELSFPDSDRPDQILSPQQERPLVLNDWIRNHKDRRISRFRGAKTVDIISTIIGDMRRANQPLNALLQEVEKSNEVDKNTDFAYLLGEYERMLHDRNWIDREVLPAKLDSVPLTYLKEQQIILYEVDYVFESQKTGLQKVLCRLSSNEDKVIANIQYEPKQDGASPITLSNWLKNTADQEGWSYQRKNGSTNGTFRLSQKLMDDEVLSNEELKTQQDKKRLFVENHHDARIELREALRRIRLGVAQSQKGEQGSKFSDYVILAGDLQHYQDLAYSLSGQYEVPVYCSRGPVLGSHPIIRRFMTLLSLELNDFQIDDIYQIFADNQFKLNELKDDDENVTPNIRSFCQFCREYNLRTLTEAKNRLDRIIDNRLRQITDDKVYRNVEQRSIDQKKVRNNAAYYKKIIRILEAYRKQFDIKQKRSLSDWITWAKKQVKNQANLGSTVANQTRQDLLNVLDEVLATHKRLGLHPDLKMADFIEIVTLALEGKRESNPDQPEAVLLSDVTYFTGIQDKITFLLGMNEGAFPQPMKTDFLRFRYQKAFNRLLKEHSPDPFLEARHHLQRLLDNAPALYLSRYRLSGQSQVIGSALWQDVTHILQISDEEDDDTWNWEKLPEDTLVSQYEWRRYQAKQIDQSVFDWWDSSRQPAHHQLIAAVEIERSQRNKMGIYDGVLQPENIDPVYRKQIEKQVELWWNRKVKKYKIYRTSISRLDEYANSPLEYFFNRVLRLEPLAQYHDDAESDVKGSILHKILQEFYTPDSGFASNNRSLIDPVDDNTGKAKDRMKEIALNVMEEYSDQMGYPDSPFPAILRTSMLRTLDGFLKYETKQKDLFKEEIWKNLRPATFHPQTNFTMEYHWEVPFDIGHIDEKVVLNGFVDRIDTDPEGIKAIVYDYKSSSGGIKKFDEDILKGLSFQLPVYGYALLKNGVRQFAGAYYYLPIDSGQNKIEWRGFLGDIDFFQDEEIYNKRGKHKLKKDFMGLMSADEVQNFLNELMETRVADIIRLIRKGTFNLSMNGQKSYSDYKMITRYNRQIQNGRERIERTFQLQEEAQKRYYLPLEMTKEDN